MLKRNPQAATPSGQAAALDIRIASLATAVPPYRYSQEEALTRARKMFPDLEHLDAVFSNTGISCRYSCVPLDWFSVPHGWVDRNETYERCALDLLERAAREAMEKARLGPDDVGAIVTVSTTGLAVPSLDATLMHRLELMAGTERLPIFGLGCAGGVSGMSRAARLAATMEGQAVLMLCVELCGLNFRRGGNEKLNFVSTALFSDGAAALVLRANGPGEGDDALAAIEATGEHNWPDSGDVMGWSIEEDGFGVVMSTQIPQFARTRLRDAVDGFLRRQGLELTDIDGVVAHPGGRKVLEAMSAALDLEEKHFAVSWEVLNEYGNMSSPTVLFVLERTLATRPSGRYLMIAFGPGFTVSFALLRFTPEAARK